MWETRSITTPHPQYKKRKEEEEEIIGFKCWKILKLLQILLQNIYKLMSHLI